MRYICGMNKYEVVVGLEIHIQLNTQSKIFCGDALSVGSPPNTHTSTVSLGLPGSLPVLNQAAIAKAIRLGLALGCTISKYNEFARKHYFYPDLPKGYQITQSTHPICWGGALYNNTAPIHIHHIHLEEDAGKSLHDQHPTHTYIDLNRAGTPLLELVTEPCIHSSDDAHWFLTEIRRLVRWLNVSDGNLEAGSLRCDANVSIRLQGTKTLGNRVEIKNLNSMRNVKRAIDGEVLRQIQLANQNLPIVQQTRGYNAQTNTTQPLRDKEAAHDYRYFPDPDLPPHHITQKQIDTAAAELPELPQNLQNRLITQYLLTPADAQTITENLPTALYYLDITAHTTHHKQAANWLLTTIKSYLNTQNQTIQNFVLQPAQIAKIINLVADQKITQTNATQKLFGAMCENPHEKIEILTQKLGIETQNHTQNTDIDALAQVILQKYPDKIIEYKKGKKGLMGLFVGEIMQQTAGKADAKWVTQWFETKLKE
jgi:aspartyl-tRNA(Asn)/glutamyl-tRNA(Gln) amidotransferase subunit B